MSPCSRTYLLYLSFPFFFLPYHVLLCYYFLASSSSLYVFYHSTLLSVFFIGPLYCSPPLSPSPLLPFYPLFFFIFYPYILLLITVFFCPIPSSSFIIFLFYFYHLLPLRSPLTSLAFPYLPLLTPHPIPLFFLLSPPLCPSLPFRSSPFSCLLFLTPVVLSDHSSLLSSSPNFVPCLILFLLPLFLPLISCY